MRPVDTREPAVRTRRTTDMRSRWPALAFGLSLAAVLVASASDGAVQTAMDSPATVATGHDVADQASSTITSVDPPGAGDDQPDSWLTFGAWEAPTTLAVNGAELSQLSTIHECFNDECGTPIDYWRTQDFVVAAGSEVEIRSGSSIELLPTVRRLSDDLSFETRSEQSGAVGVASLVLNTPGLHHIDIRGDVGFDEVRGLTRFRHFMWVQVVDDSASCLNGKGGATSVVTGVVDSTGCPLGSATLNIESLHPEFHCAPWPATLTLRSHPGASFAKTGFDDRSIDIVTIPPADLEPTGSFIESGEIFTADSDPDAVFLANSNGEIERWGPDEGVGCD